jgi:hypothetical protein
MKNFTQTVHTNFKQNYDHFLEQHPIDYRHLPEIRKSCILNAYSEYVEHENNLIKLVNFLIDKGADPRSIVSEPKV